MKFEAGQEVWSTVQGRVRLYASESFWAKAGYPIRGHSEGKQPVLHYTADGKEHEEDYSRSLFTLEEATALGLTPREPRSFEVRKLTHPASNDSDTVPAVVVLLPKSWANAREVRVVVTEVLDTDDKRE